MKKELVELRNRCNHLKDEKLIELIDIIINAIPKQDNAFEEMQPKEVDGNS